MKRITTPTRVFNKFGAGKDGFTDGDVIGGVQATDLEATWFDQVQEEIASVIEAAGFTLNASSVAQLLQAIRILGGAAPVGSTRNAAMTVAVASASATFSADEIVVSSALGGSAYRLPAFNKTVNLATVGAGGMDTGAAPVSGYVALYAIYNPTTTASALLAVNATAAVAPSVYSGANMPAGYSASALVSVWPTNASSQLIVAAQIDRQVNIPPTIAINTSTTYAAGSTISIAGVVPKNAKFISGSFIVGSSVASTLNALVSGNSSRIGEQGITINTANSTGSAYANVALISPQVMGILFASSAGAPTFSIYISSYIF